MKFYLVCTVPRLGFRMTALGDSMDVADACFAYETAVGKEIYIIKKICALCVCDKKAWTPVISLLCSLQAGPFKVKYTFKDP